MSPLSRGLFEMLGVVGAFVALGLLGQGVGAREASRAYLLEMESEAESRGGIWLVDGYNVLCSGILGGRERSRWWSEERREELLQRLGEFDDPNVEIWVVFDGERKLETIAAREGRVHAVFAPSADEWLVAEIHHRAGEHEVAVVTADRKLADRSRHRGARVVSPRELLGRCMS